MTDPNPQPPPEPSEPPSESQEPPGPSKPQPPDPLAIEPTGPWQPPRGPKTRLIAWLILVTIGLGLLVMLIMALGG